MRILSLVFSLVLLLAMAGDALAFKFSPFRVKFNPSGAGASQLFTVENNTEQPATVQIRVTTREVDINGVEKNNDAEKDFIIYPAQLALRGHESRSVRIQWVGDPNLSTEKAYRIIAEQLPVDLSKDKRKRSAVRFLVDYRASAFVTPAGLAPNVTLSSYEATTIGKEKMLALVFNNSGTQHALLRNLTLKLKNDKGNIVTLSSNDTLKNITGENILAGHSRRFLLPWPQALTGSPTTIEFTFDKKAF
jgi:fimbrial chaperone protein